MEDFNLQYGFCTAIGCKGNHSFERITILVIINRELRNFMKLLVAMLKSEWKFVGTVKNV